MKPIWTMVPKGDVATHAAGIYASMNREGTISLNKTAHNAWGNQRRSTFFSTA